MLHQLLGYSLSDPLPTRLLDMVSCMHHKNCETRGSF